MLNGTALCAEPFPVVEAENLLGRKVTLPEATKGHPVALVIGFTHASQGLTKAWGDRLATQVETYTLAVLEDVPRLVRGVATSGIKSGVAQNDRERFLLVFHNEKELKSASGFERPNDAYILLIDSQGLVAWRFHGPFAESALADLKMQLTGLEKPR